MHWHAIRQSKNSYENADAAANVERFRLDGNGSRFNAYLNRQDHIPAYATGDDACDIWPEPQHALKRSILQLATGSPGMRSSSKAIIPAGGSAIPQASQAGYGFEHVSCALSSTSFSSSSRPREENIKSLNSSFSPPRSYNELIPLSSNATLENGHTFSTRTILPFPQVNIPSNPTNNLAPFAYQRALRNRIRDDELSPGRKYDIKAYTPMFLHDCLMMPGSLANVRGKGSSEDVVRRITPALLPGFHAHVHAATHEPLLLQSSKPGDYVHGMLVFGQSKDARHNVHQHYRSSCRRVKVKVELDLVHPVPSRIRTHPGERWELRRRSVWAHAWIWKNAQSSDARFRSHWADHKWRFDDCLAGKCAPAQSLRIEPAGWIEDEWETVATEDAAHESRIDESSLTDWKVAEDEHFGEWEQGSGEGGAVPWDDDAWNRMTPAISGEEEDQDNGRGALNGDYDRSGSAGFW